MSGGRDALEQMVDHPGAAVIAEQRQVEVGVLGALGALLVAGRRPHFAAEIDAMGAEEYT